MASARFDEVDWYDLPRYYDLVFGEGTSREARFLEGVHARYGTGARTRPRVLEPACGSGRLVAALARRGWSVRGFDLNERMLDHARARLRRARLRARLDVQDLASFRVAGAFELAHCLVSTFKYLLDERAAAEHLRRVARALVPGGVYVLGLHLTDYAQSGRLRERWVAGRGSERVVCNIQSWPPDRRRRLEHVRSRLVVESPKGIRRLETCWDFRTYDARQLGRLLARVPALELVAVHDFCYELERPVELGPDAFDVVLVLRRRRSGGHPRASV